MLAPRRLSRGHGDTAQASQDPCLFLGPCAPFTRSMQAPSVACETHARVSASRSLPPALQPSLTPCSLVSAQAVTHRPLSAHARGKSSQRNVMQCAFTFQSWGEATGCSIS